MDIEQEVFNAFQIEHREQLQSIRSLLLEMENRGADTRAECIDEAFRMAHSLKGGARVCDLRPAETLGHGLETVFSRLREGALDLDDRVVRTVNVVLDGIEDWMAAIVGTELPPEPAEALLAVQRLVEDCAAADAGPADDATESLEQQLRWAFQSEYRTYADGLRAFLENHRRGAAGEPCDVEEAFRMAHDLRASARAAGADEVARLADPLEVFFRSFRDGAAALDDRACQAAEATLQSIEEQVRRESITDPAAPSQRAGSEPPAATATHTVDQPPAPQPGPVLATPAEPPIETVRVRADSLDRLLQSSARLLTEGMRQDQITRQLAELRLTVESMQRERDSFRRAAGATLQRCGDSPELRHVTRYCESVERHLHLLSTDVRNLCLDQQRSSWMLRSHGAHIQSDIRQARMVSAQSLFQSFPKMVRDLARDQGKQVDFKLIGADVRADRMVLQALKDPLMHMLRNAVTHGIEPADQRAAEGKPATGCVELIVKTAGNRLQVTVQDDGRGIDLIRVAEIAARDRSPAQPTATEPAAEELKRLIFEPGFTTCDSVTELAGRGMGLSVVQQTVKRLQGSLQLLDRDRPGAAITLSVPLSICTQRLLLLESAGQTYAVPLHAVGRLLRIAPGDIETLEGASVIPYRQRLVPIVGLASHLGVGDGQVICGSHPLPTVILESGPRRLALVVDTLLGERDALVQNLDAAAAREEFAGAMLMDDGAVVLVLDPLRLLEMDQPAAERLTPPRTPAPAQAENRARRVLVVDDSFTTRTLEKSILETHGYQVHVATDGIEALAQLRSYSFDAVISDLEMPRLDGFGLLEEMKKHPRMSNIPVVLVTSRDRAEDQQRGLELGAEAYIIKRKFDHQELLKTIQQVIAPTGHN